MISSKAREEIHQAICANYSVVKEWYNQKAKILSYPIYSSYDIRDGNYKISNVDANIYPAGFNNICPTDREEAPALFKKYIDEQYGSSIKKILLITEEHTKNPYYTENVWTIQHLLSQAGYIVKLAFPQNLENPITITSSTGKEVTIESGYESSAFFKEFNPDLIISNNDFSQELAEWAGQVTKPMNPPHELGWYQRKKSNYFDHYNSLVNEFAAVAKFDPFLFRIETEYFPHFDINSEDSRKELSAKVGDFLARLKESYKQRGIEQEPFCFVKNNAGTYGLAVIRVNDAKEILEWTYNSRKKMKAAKGGREVEEVIIQEGIPTITTAESFIAEPVIYMVGSELAGGFLRSHPEKSATESLNSPGAVYKKLCVSDLLEDAHSCPLENVYGWSAKLGVLAIGLEAEQMNAKFTKLKV